MSRELQLQQEQQRRDLLLGKLPIGPRTGGVWRVRGPTKMAKKMSSRENSGNRYESLPMSVNFYGVTSFIKAWVFSLFVLFCFPADISAELFLGICFSSLVWDPLKCLNWVGVKGSLSTCSILHLRLGEPSGFRVGPGWVPPFQSSSQRGCSHKVGQQAPCVKVLS